MREVSGKPMTVVCLISPDLKINQKSLGRDGSKCWLGKQPVVSGDDNYSYAIGFFMFTCCRRMDINYFFLVHVQYLRLTIPGSFY